MSRILIADDHPMIHKGLFYLISDQFPGASLHAAYNGRELFSALKNHSYDLLILDINMPLLSFSDFEQIILVYGSLKILVYTQYSDEHFAIRYLKKGAYGYLNKGASDEELITVIKGILNGNKYFSPFVMDIVINNINGKNVQNPLEQLSGREYEIVFLIAKGNSLTEIGNHMHISLSAVSTYKNRAMQKLNVKTLVDLIELAKQYLK
jgi:two-component system, NarL family, invasion response regulator UvrY